MNKILRQNKSDRIASKIKSKRDKKNEMLCRDEEASIYEKLISDYQHRVEIKTCLEKLNPKKDELILDAGCGTGRLIPLLLRLTKKNSLVCGIDLSFKSLHLAKSKFDKNRRLFYVLVQGSVTDLPFKSELFDLIVCSEVFEHILDKSDQIKMLTEFRRCLKSNGTLILSTYNYCIFDKLRNVPKVYNNSDGRTPNYVRLTKKELYNILLIVFKKEEIISMHGGLCLWGLPNKIRKNIWSLSNKFVRCLELLLFKSILGFFFGHLHFVKIVKKDK